MNFMIEKFLWNDYVNFKVNLVKTTISQSEIKIILVIAYKVLSIYGAHHEHFQLNFG